MCMWSVPCRRVTSHCGVIIQIFILVLQLHCSDHSGKDQTLQPALKNVLDIDVKHTQLLHSEGRLVLLAEEGDTNYLINACFLFLYLFCTVFIHVNCLSLLFHRSTHTSASAKKISEQIQKQRKHFQKGQREIQD